MSNSWKPSDIKASYSTPAAQVNANNQQPMGDAQEDRPRRPSAEDRPPMVRISGIEKGIPLPEERKFGTRASLYPFDGMEVGDSFFVHGKRPGTVSTACTNRSKKHKEQGLKYVARVWQEPCGTKGVRVWRTK